MNAAILIAACLALAPVVQDDPQEKPDAKEELRRAIESDPALSEDLKKAMLRYLGDQDEPEKSEATIWDDVAERLKIYGDFRLRGEFNRNVDATPNRNRTRIRARLGATYEVLDWLDIGARIVTLARGSGIDPNSTHVTLGRGFDKAGFELDRAYIKAEVACLEGMTIAAGKFGHPARRNPVYTVVWDSDAQPEGGKATYKKKLDEGVLQALQLTLAEYVTVEGGAIDEGSVFFAELSADFAFGDHDKSFLSVAYYKYSNLTPDGSAVIFAQNAGNATVGGVDFLSEFQIIHATLGVTYTGWEIPLKVGLEYWKNTDAEIAEDMGWSAGVKVGKVKDLWDWEAYAQYQLVEQDSLFSPFASDDFVMQTNYEGLVAGVKVGAGKGVHVHFWILVLQRDKPGTTPATSGDADQLRWRIDINIKF